MVFSNYTSNFTRKWRLFFLVICIILILGQIYVLTYSKSSTTTKKPIDNTVIPLNEERQQNTNQTTEQVVLEKTEPTVAQPPHQKQSVLLGFGGFYSKLPQIQHNFSPEPAAYTQLREKRRRAVKKSFLHGWNGYSKYKNKN
jgi:mannosyl-oligosaccharide alpha-1,2-mannosidase